MAEVLFYVLSALAVATGLNVVAAKSPMASVISLLASFFALALIYLLSGFQFMAAVQVLVYVGAIMVLFLYVIMLLNLSDIGQAAEADLGFLRGRWAWCGGLVAGLIAIATLIAVQRAAPPAADPEAVRQGIDSLDALALELFGRYVVPFEAVGMLLLATMAAVVALAKRDRGPRPGARAERERS